MEELSYKCPKCGNTEYETGSIRAKPASISKIFDVQSQKFATVTCRHCKYTELYRADVSELGDIFESFTE